MSTWKRFKRDLFFTVLIAIGLFLGVGIPTGFSEEAMFYLVLGMIMFSFFGTMVENLIEEVRRARGSTVYERPPWPR